MKADQDFGTYFLNVVCSCTYSLKSGGARTFVLAPGQAFKKN